MKDFLNMLLEKVEGGNLEAWETNIILKLMCEYDHAQNKKELDDMSCYALGWYIYKMKKDNEQ